MPSPALESWADDLYDRLTPIAAQDPVLGWPLANYCGAIGTMFQKIDDYARDQMVNGRLAPGWSQLLDPDRCPVEALPWLGMFVGVVVNTALSEAAQRAQVKAEGGWARGTLGAIASAAQATLYASYSDAVLKYKPSLYWRLTDPVGATAAADASGNDHAGVVGTGVTFGGIKAMANDPATSAIFSGAADAVITSGYKPFVAGSKRTYLGWAYQSNGAGNQPLFTSDSANPPVLYMGSGNLAFHADVTSSSQLAWATGVGVGTWFRWTLTYDDSTGVAEAFVNGVSLGQQTLPAGQGYIGSGNLQIGNLPGWSGFIGNMQDFAIYEGILTAAQIAAIYNARTIPAASGGKEVIIIERDPTVVPSQPAYGLTVHTRASQTPSAADTLAALLAAKPGGIVLNYSTITDTTYQDIFNAYATYQAIYNTFHTYQGVMQNTPGL